MKLKGIPIWLGIGAIIVVCAVVYFLLGFEQALGALVLLAALYFFPWDNGVAAGNAEAAKVDAYRERWLARRKGRPQEPRSSDSTD
ncbi:hypothetical protein ACX80U_16390 [Arthrobacter sp. TmT3-37]